MLCLIEGTVSLGRCTGKPALEARRVDHPSLNQSWKLTFQAHRANRLRIEYLLGSLQSTDMTFSISSGSIHAFDGLNVGQLYLEYSTGRVPPAATVPWSALTFSVGETSRKSPKQHQNTRPLLSAAMPEAFLSRFAWTWKHAHKTDPVPHHHLGNGRGTTERRHAGPALCQPLYRRAHDDGGRRQEIATHSAEQMQLHKIVMRVPNPPSMHPSEDTSQQPVSQGTAPQSCQPKNTLLARCGFCLMLCMDSVNSPPHQRPL
ncbi:hypothetical protein IAQ61_010366 [Plenodomus lingam]|uniref:uncharacterized protein n=1 Tax=Leptosphaeria maculans TaxID=5022 RepID=UPI00332C8810|nr:hypothetical protein IAQ61_010366 [Plenodomus lingam]